MAFDLNLLLTFEAMDKARSVSGAAQLLGLSQPAASAALARLRKALGDELFTYAGGRCSRPVRLTLPHLMALPDILRATDLVAVVPARAAARFGPGVERFDVGFLNLAPWTLHMLWSPHARKDRARAWLRAVLTRVCATL